MTSRYSNTRSNTPAALPTSSTSSSSSPSNDSISILDKVASASTALDRVLGLLDGFEDDMDCPLCLEEMDISDLNFKPCPCGYQICRFCWNHIKEDLNGRCPACRSPYDDNTVEFKPIKPEELKRLQAAKKLRDKRRKEEAASVKNLANVRVRQRAQVHIQGMTTKIANEDTLNQLKGPEQFGQYGKVVKLFMSKRSPSVTQPISPHPHHQPVNVYVNYRTAAEAASCITAMDGLTTSDGHKIKAIWGTTRYCPTYLKGLKCNNENCMQAHEPGEEIEAGPTSREEIYTYHAMSDTDMQRAKANKVATQRKQEAATLPATASWASKNGLPATPIIPNSSLPPLSATLKPVVPTPTPRAIPVSKPQTHPLPARPSSRSKQDASSPPSIASKSTSAQAILSAASSSSSSTKDEPSTSTFASTSSSTASSSTPVASSSSTIPSTKPQPSSSTTFPPMAVNIERPPSVPLFPDLQFGEGTFSFSLDLDVKGKGRESPTPISTSSSSTMMGGAGGGGDGVRSPRSQHTGQDFGMSSSISELDMMSSAFSAPLSNAPSYIGSFDPFSDGHSALDTTGSEGPPSGSSSPPRSATGDETDHSGRRGSRFGFARRGSQGVKGGDLASALARSIFSSPSGRESPGGGFAPPGMSFPQQQGLQQQQQHRPPSSIGFSPLPPSNDFEHHASSQSSSSFGGNIGGLRSPDPSSLWTANGGPPGVGLLGRSSFASPGQSTSPSPQISPRAPPPLHQHQPSSPLPPGISLSSSSTSSSQQTPIPAAQFPLPPPNPRSSGSQNGNTAIGKDDILALIAAAQQQSSKSIPMQQQENYRTFFSDPAILSAQLPNHRNNVGGGGLSTPNGMVGLPTNNYHWQEQQYNSQRGGFALPPQEYNSQRGGFALPPQVYPPPGVRQPPQLQAFQQQAGLYRS